MGNLSKNFSESEFLCQSCNILHAPIHFILLETLQGIRDEHGKPLIVTSGSRCEKRQGLLKEADLSNRVATNSPHVPRICKDGKYWTVATDVACFFYPTFIASSIELQQANRDFVRNLDTKCRIGWRKYAGRSFLHLDVAYLVDRDYIKDFCSTPNRVLASWVVGCEW